MTESTRRALFDDAVLVLNTEQKREVAEYVKELEKVNNLGPFWRKWFSSKPLPEDLLASQSKKD